jgi:hypothetical protein
VPANAATSQAGVSGTCASATAESAATRAIWPATSHSTSTRPPAALVWPVTRASWPSEQSSAYANCQPSSASSPTGQAHTRPSAIGPAAATTTKETRQLRPRFATVSTVGASRCLWAKTAIRAPTRWLIASLNSPPPRFTP